MDMELHLIEKTADTIIVGVKDPDMTAITPILGRILDDGAVLDAEFTDVHPELEDPVIMIKVKDGDPGAVFKRATDALVADFRVARESLSGQI